MVRKHCHFGRDENGAVHPLIFFSTTGKRWSETFYGKVIAEEIFSNTQSGIQKMHAISI